MARGTPSATAAAAPANPAEAARARVIEKVAAKRGKAAAGVASTVERLSSYAIEIHMSTESASLENLETLMADYVDRRITSPMGGWKKIESWCMPTEASKIVSAIRRTALLSGIPGFGGALVKAILSKHGAFQRRTHSCKFPIHLWDLIRWREKCGESWSEADALCWDSCIIQFFFGLRFGIMPELLVSHFTRVGGGYLLVWHERTKTTPGETARPIEPKASAAKHPLIDGSHGETDGWTDWRNFADRSHLSASE
jgi:hypothetical protein